MTPSMDDVARQAGVSKSTVSLVLNERPGASEEMRNRVLDAAGEIGYSLPVRRSKAGVAPEDTHAPVIALVHCVGDVPDIDPGLTHLYLSYRNGIQRFTHGRDISVMLVTSYREGHSDSLGHQLLTQPNHAFDGLILMGPGLQRNSLLIQRAMDQQIPTVILGRSWADVPISSVSQDHREQAVLVMDHLLALGHRHIGFIARNIDRNYDWFELRLQAYRHALGNLMPEVGDAYISIAHDAETATTHLLASRPEVSAIFAMNDHIAYRAMRAAQAAGRTIPGDLSIVGIDGVFEPQEGLPRLTTVTFPHEEVGYLAAELLIKQFENSFLRNARLLVRSRLLSGNSCAVAE